MRALVAIGALGAPGGAWAQAASPSTGATAAPASDAAAAPASTPPSTPPSATAAPAAAAPAAAPPAAAPPAATPPAAGATAAEQPRPERALEWRYPTFRTGEYVATGLFVGAAVGGLFIPVDPPRWTERNGLDGSIRDALKLGTREARGYADDASDVTLALSINYMLFDSVVVAWWGRNKGSVAYEMTLVDIETLAFTNAVTSVVKGVVARERPYGQECGRDAKYARTDDCDADARYRSFFSGHTSTTFAAASVNCMHHMHLDLYGGGAPDVAACVAAYAAATGTGVLRVMSDNHHFTDVAVGAAFGTLAGVGLPWLLHYGHDAPAKGLGRGRDDLRVQLIPGPTSATLVGEF